MPNPYPIPKSVRESEVKSGDGRATYGPFGFKIFDVDDIVVYLSVNGQAWIKTDVLVSKTAPVPFSEFTVTFPAPIGLETRYQVVGSRVHRRETDLFRGGSINSNETEKEMSKQAIVLQEERRDLGKSLRFSPGYSGSNLLPNPERGKALVGNPDGTGYVNAPVGEGDIAVAVIEAQNARDQAVDARNVAVGASASAAGSAATASSAASTAVDAKNTAVAASGSLHNYDTLAEANADIANIPNNAGVTILADGNRNGFYVKQGGVLIKKSTRTLAGFGEFGNTATFVHNWNEIDQSGTYKSNPTGEAPIGGPGAFPNMHLLHIEGTGGRAHQIAIAGNLSAPRMWERGRTREGVWTEWVEILTTANTGDFSPSSSVIADLDAIARAGFYQAAADAIGSPIRETSLVLHIQGADMRAKQLLWRTASTENAGGWFRIRGASGVWQDWAEIPTGEEVSTVRTRLDDVVFAQNYDNIFSAETITTGFVLASSGGALEANELFYTSDFIPVSPGQPIALTVSPTPRRVAYFNASKSHIMTAQNAGGDPDFNVPATSSIRYMRISPRLATNPPADFTIVVGAALPSRPALPAARKPVQEWQRNQPGGFVGIGDDGSIPGLSSPLAGKVIAGLGDSITYGFIPRNYEGYPGRLNSWLPLMGDIVGAAGTINYGISGSTLAYHATRNPMSRRFAAMDDGADIVIVMGGTNDVRNGIVLGEMGDTTDATYYGALDVIAIGLLNKYRNAPQGERKKVVFSTPIRLLDPAAPDGLQENLPAFCEAVKLVGKKYGIPVFDAYNLSGLTPELFRTLQGTEPGYTNIYNPYVTDGTHPTQEGQRILADAFAGFMRGLY